MSSSSTSGPARACLPARCSKQARVWSRSSGTRPSRPGFALGSEAASRSSRPMLSTGVVPTEPFAVVANLPFAGSGAILSRLLRGPVTRAVVIVDWAFAQKQVAVWPTTLKSVLASLLRARARETPRPHRVRSAPERGRGRDALHAAHGSARADRRCAAVLAVPVVRSTRRRKSGAMCSRRFRRNGWHRPSAFDRPRGHETSTRASGPASTPRPGARRPGYDDE